VGQILDALFGAIGEVDIDTGIGVGHRSSGGREILGQGFTVSLVCTTVSVLQCGSTPGCLEAEAFKAAHCNMFEGAFRARKISWRECGVQAPNVSI
jgi:hypothetical protein